MGQVFIDAPPRLKALFFIGIILACAMLGVRIASPAFEYGERPPLQADIVFLILMAGAGAVYMVLFRVLFRAGQETMMTRGLLLSIFLVGVFMRVVFFASTPISEDDWHRYLWDGAAVSHGVNPYAYPPSDAFLPERVGAFGEEADLDKLKEIGAANPETLSRINYPYVSTIYPPLTQLGFAAAHVIAPFNLDAWRLVLLIADAAGFFLLASVLQAVGRSSAWSALYWWNPVVVVTTFNAGHMDILLTPFILGAVLLVLKERPYWAAISLAAAAGVKFWPVILAPVLFGRWLAAPFKLARIAAVFVVAAAAFVAPMLLSLDIDHSGLAAYAQTWERNAFLFPLIAATIDALGADGDFLARLLSAGIVCGTAIGLGFAVKANASNLLPALFITTTLLFFLSPTGFPWYFIWIAMFLPFVPSVGVGLLTVTLSIYYMRFPLQENGLENVFATYLTPLEFLVPLGVIAWERWRARA